MNRSRAWVKLLLPLLAVIVTMNAVALDGVRSSSHYNVRTDNLDAGGQHSTSANYGMDDSLADIGGISSAVSPAETMKQGYIGQLYEVTSMVVTAIPAIVSESGNSQLGATVVLDDSTILIMTGSNVNWNSSGFPLASISAGGLLTPSAVYTDTASVVHGYYLGASNVVGVVVLDTNPDNFGNYAFDGIPDGWQIQYFGLNNPQGTAAADADGTGHNNLFKYLAGLNPTNPASDLRITSMVREGNDVRVTWKCVGGHSYVVQSTKRAAIAQYAPRFADVSPLIVVPGVDETTSNYLDAGAAYAPVLPPPGGSTNQLIQTGTSTVSCSAQFTRGIANSLEVALPTGSAVMLGAFTIGDAAIQSNFFAGNLSAIMSAFIPYGAPFAVGDGTGQPASWSVSRSASGFDGRQIYLVAIDAPSESKAVHLGIFTAPSWVFPASSGEIAIDLDAATGFVIGSLGGPVTINLGLGQTYTFNDTARLSALPGRELFYRVRLGP